jgi:hypothetical protein
MYRRVAFDRFSLGGVCHPRPQGEFDRCPDHCDGLGCSDEVSQDISGVLLSVGRLVSGNKIHSFNVDLPTLIQASKSTRRSRPSSNLLVTSSLKLSVKTRLRSPRPSKNWLQSLRNCLPRTLPRSICVDQQHSRRLVTGRRKDNSDRVGLFKLIDFGALFADQEFVQRKAPRPSKNWLQSLRNCLPRTLPRSISTLRCTNS